MHSDQTTTFLFARKGNFPVKPFFLLKMIVQDCQTSYGGVRKAACALIFYGVFL